MGKGLLASALTLPVAAFVAGVFTSPDPVDPGRSRPVIIGRVSDDQPPPGPRGRSWPVAGGFSSRGGAGVHAGRDLHVERRPGARPRAAARPRLGLDFDPGSNVVDVYVGYLRKKFGAGAITTVRGMGYRFSP